MIVMLHTFGREVLTLRVYRTGAVELDADPAGELDDARPPAGPFGFGGGSGGTQERAWSPVPERPIDT